MKNIFLASILIFGLSAMSASCNNKTKVLDGEATVAQDSEMTPHSLEEDCHGVRKTIRTVKNKEGTIMMIGNNVTISIGAGTERYKVCEVPKQIQIDGIKVSFSGEILEIFHNERLMGTPLRLKEIIKID